MNEECKYCSYLKKCPDRVEHNSIYCQCHKRIPKDRNMSYEQLQNNWNELKKWLEEEYKYYQKCGNPNIGHAMGQIRRTENKMQELVGNK